MMEDFRRLFVHEHDDRCKEVIDAIDKYKFYAVEFKKRIASGEVGEKTEKEIYEGAHIALMSASQMFQFANLLDENKKCPDRVAMFRKLAMHIVVSVIEIDNIMNGR